MYAQSYAHTYTHIYVSRSEVVGLLRREYFYKLNFGVLDDDAGLVDGRIDNSPCEAVGVNEALA